MKKPELKKTNVILSVAVWKGCDLTCTGSGRESGGGGWCVEGGNCVVGTGAGVRVSGAGAGVGVGVRVGAWLGAGTGGRGPRSLHCCLWTPLVPGTPSLVVACKGVREVNSWVLWTVVEINMLKSLKWNIEVYLEYVSRKADVGWEFQGTDFKKCTWVISPKVYLDGSWVFTFINILYI